MDRYLCIHGHFYQPQRENPWLEAIELQESAYPYHDWNERITAECYGPMARSRILDGDGRIVRIVNNYVRMSFNLGPTLLSWMQQREPEVYTAVLEADRQSRERFGGHGAAIAQGYGHIILPLANDRDRRTQVVWGVRDFEHRFGRKPEGMWLPETAANTASLEALAEQGIKFTILAPRQARRVRKHGGKWKEVGGAVDPSTAYEAHLPSGRKIALFFYDGPISQGVAFERLLDSGEKFANRLLAAFDEKRTWAQLAHIATDGESYGHHHRHGDMALAYALEHIEQRGLATLTNYGQFLDLHPPTHQAEIHENSSWSCIHGVERWRSDCGCNSGGNAGWDQAWRGPLREALDWLRDATAPRYEQAAGELFKDPWAARDAYIEVLLDRSPESVGRFFEAQRSRELSEEEQVRALKLLELQRHAMLMYTSCGWFFDELSGIETVQVIQYAGRVVQLAHEVLGDGLEGEFLSRLERAQSNLPEHGNGRNIYEKWVKPAAVDLSKVAAHYAISTLFEEYGDDTGIYCYDVHREEARVWAAGRARAVVGRARLTSRITRESGLFTYGVLHLGDNILNGGIRPFQGEEAYARIADQVAGAFDRAEYADVLRAMDEAFGSSNYSLRSLFKDEQRRVVDRVLESTLTEVEANFRQIYENHAPLVRFLAGIGVRPPRGLQIPAEFTLNANVAAGARSDPPDLERMRAAIEEAKVQRVELDAVALAFALENTLERQTERLASNPRDGAMVSALADLIGFVAKLPFEVDVGMVQNAYYPLLATELPEIRAAAESGDNEAGSLLRAFLDLGERLRVKVE